MNLLLFKDKDDLLQTVEEQCQYASDEFKHSAKLYHLARYFVAVHESHHGKMLLQVWNEYRNAIDHFFRFQTSQHSDDAAFLQLKKMEGHLQRALFDALKLVCHRTIDRVELTFNKYAKRHFDYIDNSEYLPQLTKDLNLVRDQLSIAKTSDISLGGSQDTDDEVLGRYLDAAIFAHKISHTLSEKEPLLQKAKTSSRVKFVASTLGFGILGSLTANWISSPPVDPVNSIAITCPVKESHISSEECLTLISNLTSASQGTASTTDQKSLEELPSNKKELSVLDKNADEKEPTDSSKITGDGSIRLQ